MEELLERLYISLRDVFGGQLGLKDLEKFENGEIDVFKTYLCLSKSQRDFRKLLELSAINKEVLVSEFSKDFVNNALKNGSLLNGATINNDRLFIGTAGLYKYYILKDLDLSQVFISFDEHKFRQEKIKLKLQEKVWCIFLILFDAVSEEKVLDTTKLSNLKLNQYFNFFKLIEAELIKQELVLGKEIGWGTGKDVGFRKFITNNVDLPSTGIYNDRPTSKYWLDFGKKKNVTFLLNLILDSYSVEERILANSLFSEVLRNLSNQLLTVLHEMPRELNGYVVEELRS
jgi:hypothetical protein